MDKSKIIDIPGHQAAEKKAEQEQVTLSPKQILTEMVADLARFADELEEATRSGRQHPHGIYARQKASVITMDGKGDQVRLVAGMVPIEALLLIRNALVELRDMQKGGGNEH